MKFCLKVATNDHPDTICLEKYTKGDDITDKLEMTEELFTLAKMFVKATMGKDMEVYLGIFEKPDLNVEDNKNEN